MSDLLPHGKILIVNDQWKYFFPHDFSITLFFDNYNIFKGQIHRNDVFPAEHVGKKSAKCKPCAQYPHLSGVSVSLFQVKYMFATD